MRDANTVNTQYRVHSLPSMTLEQTYKFPVYRIFLKNNGEKFATNEYDNIKLFNPNHVLLRSIRLVPDTSFFVAYFDASQPLITDDIYEQNSSLSTFWIQWKRLSQNTSTYMLRITNESGGNIATLPNIRHFYISELKNTEKKLITNIWDRTDYIETKVWAFNKTTPIKETPSVLEVKIYPNPSHDEIRMELLGNTEENECNFTVYNLLGQAVFSTNTTSNQCVLKKEYIGKGTFMVKISSGQKLATKKIVFQ